MKVVETITGEVCLGNVLASSMWEFIEKWLPNYSSDNDVLLSNDCSVVLEVIEYCESHDESLADYLALPESERDYSNSPFENVAEHLSVDVCDLKYTEVYQLQCRVDADLFDEAIKAYNEEKPF